MRTEKAEPAAPWARTAGRRSSVILLVVTLCLVCLTGAVIGVFAQVCRFDFVFADDFQNVYENPYFHPVTLANVLHFWRAGYHGLYIPVMYTFWAICALIAPPQPPQTGVPNPSAAVFHAANLLLHLANTILVWNLLRLMLGRLGNIEWGTPWAGPGQAPNAPASPLQPATNGASALAGALLFAIHPLQIESVAWVTGGNNLLSGFFSLLALTWYLNGRIADTEGKPGRKRLFLLATVAYALALLAKPMASTVALLAVAIDWGTSGHDWRRQSWRKILLLPTIWLLLGGMDAVITHFVSESSKNVWLPIWGRPIVAGTSLMFYLEKLVVPSDLCLDYPRSPATVIYSWWGYVDTLLIIALGVVIWKSNQRRVLQISALLFLAALLPALGFVPFDLHRHTTVADRYMYLALLGPAFLAAGLGRSEKTVQQVRHLLAAAYCCIVIFWGIQSATQTAVWSSTETLFNQVLSINPRSSTYSLSLGEYLETQGDPDAAAEVYRRAIANMPDLEVAYFDLAAVQVRRGQLDDGIANFRQAIYLNPDDAKAHLNLALALEQKGAWDDAFHDLETAQRLTPGSAEVAAALSQAHQIHDAVHGAPAPVPSPDHDPSASAENAKGIALVRAGDITGALLAFRRAIRLRPDYAEAFFNLGVTYDKRRQTADAERSYRSALLRRPIYPEAHFNLGMILINRSDYRGAEAQWQEALKERPGWKAAEKALTTLPGMK